MKTCPECGKDFKNLGAHMKAHRSVDVQERVQKADREEATGKKSPIDRFGRMVFGGGGVMFRR